MAENVTDQSKVDGTTKTVADVSQAKAKAPAVVGSDQPKADAPVSNAEPVKKAAVRRPARSKQSVVAGTRKLNQRAAKSSARKAKAKRPASVNQIEGTKTMTYDFNQLFAGFQIPGADKYQQLFAEAGERSQELAAKSQKAAEELTELAKANVEAFVTAGKIAVGGVKAIGQDVIASSREGVEQASDAVKTLAEAKSPAEFFQLQSDLARASFDRMVAETSKLTERVVKLAGEAAEPLQTRASLNAERINTLVA